MTCPHLDPWFVFAAATVAVCIALLITSYLVRTVQLVRLGEEALDKLGRVKRTDTPSLETAYRQIHAIAPRNELLDEYLARCMKEIECRERRATRARRAAFNEESGT